MKKTWYKSRVGAMHDNSKLFNSISVNCILQIEHYPSDNKNLIVEWIEADDLAEYREWLKSQQKKDKTEAITVKLTDPVQLDVRDTRGRIEQCAEVQNDGES